MMTKTKKRTITVHINEDVFWMIRKEAKKNTPEGSLRAPMSLTVEKLLKKGLTPKEVHLIAQPCEKINLNGTIIDQWITHYRTAQKIVVKDERFINHWNPKKRHSCLKNELEQLFMGCLFYQEQTELKKLLPIIQENYDSMAFYQGYSMIKPILQTTEMSFWLTIFENIIGNYGHFPWLLVEEYLPIKIQKILTKKTRRWLRDHAQNEQDLDYFIEANQTNWTEAFLLNDSFNAWLHNFIKKYTPDMHSNPLKYKNKSWNIETKLWNHGGELTESGITVSKWKLTNYHLATIISFEMVYRNLKPLVRIPRWIDEINLLPEN